MDNTFNSGNIMQESNILIEIEESIERLLPVPGLEVDIERGHSKRWDLWVKAKYIELQFDIIVEVVSANSLAAFKNKVNWLKAAVQNQNAVPVLAAPYMSPERQALCREAGINFLDLSGNVFISHRSFYLERIGFPNKYPEKRQRRDPFSDKASLILREMLKNPLKQWGIRELAEKIGLNPGYVSRMAKSLDESGFAARVKGKIRLRAPKEILDDWVRSYDIKRNKHYRYFMLAPDVKSILQRLREIHLPHDVVYALSAQAGASLVAPHAVYKEVHLYLSNPNAIDIFKAALDIKSSDQGANLVLMLPFYKHSVFYDCREVEGLRVVSDIQLYLDLYGYKVRGREQAEHLYAKRLKMLFAGNKDNG